MAYATVEELAAALGKRVTPENQATFQACLDAAAVEIDHAIDASPPPGSVVSAAADWLYSASQSASDPGAGVFRTDKNTPAASSAMYISAVDADGGNHDLIGTLQTGDLLTIGGAEFTVTGTPTTAAGWFTIPISYGGGSLSFVDGNRYEMQATRPAPDQPVSPLVNRVNLLRGVEWAKSNDAAFGVIGMSETGALTAPRDGFARHAATLMPLKERWGIA